MKVPPGNLLALRSEAVLHAYGAGQVTRIAVGGVLRRHIAGGYAVLLLQRVAGDEYGGLEELPGGGVEPGETIGEALVREVREETGLSALTAGPFLFDITYPSRRGFTAQLNFLIDVAGEPIIQVDPSEHESFRWLPVAALAESGVSSNVRDGLRRTIAVNSL